MNWTRKCIYWLSNNCHLTYMLVNDVTVCIWLTEVPVTSETILLCSRLHANSSYVSYSCLKWTQKKKVLYIVLTCELNLVKTNYCSQIHSLSDVPWWMSINVDASLHICQHTLCYYFMPHTLKQNERSVYGHCVQISYIYYIYCIVGIIHSNMIRLSQLPKTQVWDLPLPYK